MTKFYDDSKIASIEMTDAETGASFEADFFEVGGLKYNMDLDAYKVDDVEYLIDYATDYANGTNPDFDGKGDCTVDCSVEEL